MSKKVVLGFSGGLDTTFCVKYLTEEKYGVAMKKGSDLKTVIDEIVKGHRDALKAKWIDRK